MAAESSLGHRSASILKLASVNVHELDERIAFVEEGHVYYLDGVAVPTSVTGVIESVSSDHFDADVIISKMKRGRNWPNPSYADMASNGALTPWTDDRIKETWSANGKKAADLGTDLHSRIEHYMNDVDVPFLTSGPDSNRLEFQYFVDWWTAKKAEGFVPFRTEWVIFDEAAKVAGSIDFVMKNVATGTYQIVDWKRCKTKEAGFRNSYGKKFLPPLSHMDQHKLNKWSVQVNVYREILEKYYEIVIDGMSMVVFHAENTAAECFSFDRNTAVSALL